VPRAAQTTLVDGSQDEVTAQDEDGDAHPKDRDHECRHGLLLFELSCRPDNAKDMFAFPMRCFILLLRNRLCALALVVPTLVRSNQRRSPLHLAIQQGAGEPERRQLAGTVATTPLTAMGRRGAAKNLNMGSGTSRKFNVLSSLRA
jgi:hypothetical protein